MEAKILTREFFTFDDVLIRPAASAIEPREAVLHTKIAPGLALKVPVLSAAMDRVTESDMAIAMAAAGGLGVIHRNCTVEAQVAMVAAAKKAGAVVGAACGPFDTLRAEALIKAGIDVLVIDCAHGHNMKVIAAAKRIKKILKKIPLIVGNIATKEAVKDLRGVADAVKVGVGPGSICTTRIVSGVGVPQLSAIIEVADAAHKVGMTVIADGGMKTTGDIAKALGAGADAVMLGNMLAGTDEAPGAIVEKDGVRFKEYRGMGSAAVLNERKSSDRYLVEGRKAVPEGVSGYVPCKGPVASILEDIYSSVQVTMGYVGAKNLAAFHKRTQFMRISPSSLSESRPHSIFTT